MNAGEVLNTPGYYYAIAYAMSGLVIAGSNEKKRKGWKLGVVSCIQFALLLLFMTWTHGVGKALFLPAMVVIIGLMYGYIYLCNCFTVKEAGFFCVKAFINGEFGASLCWQVFYYIHELTGCSFGWQWVIMAVVYLGLFGLLFLIECYLKKDIEELNVTRRELLVVVIVAAAVFGMSNLSYLDQNGLFSGRFAMDIFIIRTLVDLSGMAVLYAYHIQVKEMQLRLEKDALRNIMEMQYKNYQLSRESIDVVNQKYHDLKHQIEFLKSDISSDEKMQYLNEMEQDIQAFEAQNHTGNHILDTILTAKSLQCQNENIQLTCVANGKYIEFMNPMDISALFGNMLDNAIEGVSKVEEKDKRWIHVSIRRKMDFLVICVSNSYQGDISFSHGMPVTQKEDKRYHGYGTKSIRNIVSQYGGTVVFRAEKGWFEVKATYDFNSLNQAGQL